MGPLKVLTSAPHACIASILLCDHVKHPSSRGLELVILLLPKPRGLACLYTFHSDSLVLAYCSQKASLPLCPRLKRAELPVGHLCWLQVPAQCISLFRKENLHSGDIPQLLVRACLFPQLEKIRACQVLTQTALQHNQDVLLSCYGESLTIRLLF